MRLNRVQEKIKKKRLDGFLITNLKNIYYLSSCSGSGIKVLLTGKSALFFSGLLYDEEAKEKVKEPFRILSKIKPKFFKGLRNLGIEENSLSLKDYRQLQKLLPKIKLVPCQDFVEEFRAIKEQEEIELLKKAAMATKKAFSSLAKELKPGISELKIAGEICSQLRKNGAEGESFPPIVASGARSSFPHANPSEKLIKENEPILLDFGGSFKGYQSDFTRTLFLGKIGEKENRLNKLLKKAQDLAIVRIQPGVMASEVDQAARDFLKTAGYGKYFIHNLGHGIGLDIHELPFISLETKKRLKPGMVFTVEPGIYIPGWGGIRREDTVVVTETGCEKL